MTIVYELRKERLKGLRHQFIGREYTLHWYKQYQICNHYLISEKVYT